MALINRSFTFVECTDCHTTIKLEVGKDIEGITCQCKDIKEKSEEKPKRRLMKDKLDAAEDL